MRTPDQNYWASELKRGFKNNTVPAYMHDALMDYVVERRIPGHFLTAVLENDLREAVVQADDANLDALGNWVKVLYNYCPSHSWGSHSRVRAWCRGEEY